jgi:hypothetical protein
VNFLNISASAWVNLLNADIYGRLPPYGLLVLADGVQEQVLFTPALERRVFQAAAEMREFLLRDADPGPEWLGPKCRACGFRTTCWQ